MIDEHVVAADAPESPLMRQVQVTGTTGGGLPVPLPLTLRNKLN